MPPKKKNSLRCDDDRAVGLSEATQIEITGIGCQIYFDIIQNKAAGILLYKIPEDSKVYANFFDGIQDVLRAAAHSRFVDIDILKKSMKRFKVETSKRKK